MRTSECTGCAGEKSCSRMNKDNIIIYGMELFVVSVYILFILSGL